LFEIEIQKNKKNFRDAVKMFENLLIRIEDEDITKVLTSELKAKLNETEFYDGIFDISTYDSLSFFFSSSFFSFLF